MKVKLIDKRLDTFWKYQTAIFQSPGPSFWISKFFILTTLLFMVTFTFSRALNKSFSFVIMGKLLIFFGCLAIVGQFFSYLSYLRNKKTSLEINSLAGKIQLIRMGGSKLMVVQTGPFTTFRFVSADDKRNAEILKEIKLIDPNVEIK